MLDALTIIWGAIGTLVGWLVYKFVIEPLHELRKVVGEVEANLAFHAPTIHTPIGRTKETSDKARDALLKCSSELFAKFHAVPLYEVTRWCLLGALPSGKDIERAAVQLRGLSTHVHDTGDRATDALEAIQKRVERIEAHLKLTPRS